MRRKHWLRKTNSRSQPQQALPKATIITTLTGPSISGWAGLKSYILISTLQVVHMFRQVFGESCTRLLRCTQGTVLGKPMRQFNQHNLILSKNVECPGWNLTEVSAFRHVVDIIHPTSKFLSAILEFSLLCNFLDLKFFYYQQYFIASPFFTSLIYEPTGAIFYQSSIKGTHPLVQPSSLPFLWAASSLGLSLGLSHSATCTFCSHTGPHPDIMGTPCSPSHLNCTP